MHYQAIVFTSHGYTFGYRETGMAQNDAGYVIVEVNQASYGWSIPLREVFDDLEEARTEAEHMRRESAAVGRREQFLVAALEVEDVIA
jgi:hypothetical protein